MDRTAERIIVQGMKTLAPSIRFNTAFDPGAVVRAAIDFEPRLMHYVSGWSLSRGFSGYELTVRYRNTDVKFDDIKTASTVEDCIGLMCNAIGAYKRKLVVVADKKMDLNKAVEIFTEKHSTFYPNLVRYATGGYYLDDGKYAVYELTFTYRIGKVLLEMMEMDVDKEVERLAKLLFLPGMPDEVKVLLAHNYLATTVTYKIDHDNKVDTSYTQSAYGALIKHQCVCQGFAEAFKRLMDFAGIECEVISGQVAGSREYHAWNIVTLGDDEYYHVDVTWDASDRKPSYEHFCKSDAFYIGKRTWNREINHQCNGGRAILSIAQNYIYRYRTTLIARGIDGKLLPF